MGLGKMNIVTFYADELHVFFWPKEFIIPADGVLGIFKI